MARDPLRNPTGSSVTGHQLRPLYLGAGLAVALLMVNIAVTFRNTRQLNDDYRWVNHTHDVLSGVESAFSLVKDAETGQRGYLITGEPRYLEPYEAALGKIGNQVDSLAELTSDNPTQQAHIAELRTRIARRLSILKEALDARQTRGFEAARQEILSDRDRTAMDAIRDTVDELIRHEQALLQDRSQKSQRSYQVALLSGLLTGIAAMAGIGTFILLLRRHLAARAKAAATIAEQEERWRTTLTSIGDAVIATDREGRVTNMNPIAELLTGWKNDEAAHKPLHDVFHIVNEATRQPVENPALRTLTEGVIVGLANHTVLIAKDGMERAIDDSAAPIRCKDGEIVGSVLVFRDVTQRRQEELVLQQSEARERETANTLRKLAAELSESDRRKDEFLAMLAHELRNPLAPIRNALQIVQLSQGDTEAIQSASEIMDRQVGQLVRLVDDLLDVSRISRGRIDLRLERVELASIIQQAIETTRPAIEHAQHELTTRLPSEPIYLYADPVRLAQVFSNLLNNSCKYSKPGGRIALTAERQNHEVVVTVKDTGIGISPEMLPKIFEMFTQIDRSLERTQGGLGIGLTLVQRIVELHRGTVSASSEGPGRGSEFVVRLPILVADEAPAPSSTSDIPTLATHSRILVVDDNRDSAQSLAMLLRMAGNAVEQAYDGVEAIETAEKFRPDIVLLDIGLPKLNGYEVAQKLRELPWGKKAILLALTGWGQDNDREKSAQAGFDGHLVKPVRHTELSRMLAELISARQ